MNRNSKLLRRLSAFMAILLLAVFVLEAPLYAAFEAIKVNIGGKTIQVTPGEWIAVRQGTQVVHYNVRYIDGKPVALEMSQYLRLIFGGEAAGQAAANVSTLGKPTTSQSIVQSQQSQAITQTQNVTQTKPTQTNVQSINLGANQSIGTVAPNKPSVVSASNQQIQTQAQVQTQVQSSQQTQSQILSQFQLPSGNSVQTVQTKPSTEASTQSMPKAQADAIQVNQSQISGKSGGTSWIKEELTNYGQQIKESFKAGKSSGQDFGTKTVDSAKNLGEQAGSKIGDLLRGAKERFERLFKRTHVSPKSDSMQTSQSSTQSTQTQSHEVTQLQQSQQTPQTTQQSSQSNQTSQNSQSVQTSQTNQSSNAQSSSQAQQQANQQVNQSQQNTQSSSNSVISGHVEQSQSAGQSSQSDQFVKKPGFFDKTMESFKTGYDKGKAMANQGIQNVKDSLKAGFSPRNLLVTAGITVAVDLGMQIMRGEKPSLQKALKTVCSAEFAGGVAGSVLGAAAGSFFVPFLSAVPVVGGFLSALAPTFGSVVGSSVGAYLAGDLKNGRFSLRNAFRNIDWVGVTGQSIGSVVGTMIGSMIFPPFGTIIGGIVGGMVGNWAAHKIAALFGKDKGFGSIAMPVGTNPYADAGQTVSGIGIGAVAGNSEIPVYGNQTSAPAITIEGNVEPIGTYASEIQLAYAKYQELYRLYNELLAQGRQADAIRVAQEMNKAKAEYETLKAKAGVK